MPEELAWSDGKIIPLSQIHISPACKGLNYGLATFEGIRAYKAHTEIPPEFPPSNSAIFRLPEHVERWLYSMKVLRFNILYSKNNLEQAIKTVVNVNDLRECYIRPIAWDATEKIGIHGEPEKVGIAIFAREFGKYIPKEGLNLMISSYIRPHPKTTVSKAKLAANYHNSYLATMEAHDHGYDEALMLDTRGYISELPGANVMIIKGRKIFTLPSKASILPGITRDTIMKISPELRLKVEEMDILPKQLYEADEAFACGTAMEVNGIVNVFDGKKNHVIGKGEVGEITKKILQKYKQIVTGFDVKHRDWLTYVYSK